MTGNFSLKYLNFCKKIFNCLKNHFEALLKLFIFLKNHFESGHQEEKEEKAEE